MIAKVFHCPSCGGCFRCSKPHVVMLNESEGVGVLCRFCWDILDVDKRIEYHFGHWRYNHAKWWELLLLPFTDPPSWARIKRAVQAVEEFQGYCQTCGEYRTVLLRRSE